MNERRKEEELRIRRHLQRISTNRHTSNPSQLSSSYKHRMFITYLQSTKDKAVLPISHMRPSMFSYICTKLGTDRLWLKSSAQRLQSGTRRPVIFYAMVLRPKIRLDEPHKEVEERRGTNKGSQSGAQAYSAEIDVQAS